MPTLYQLSSPFTLLLLLQQWQLFASLFTHAETFLYGEFNESRILLQKDASLHSERVITLTNQTLRSMGRALYPTPIRIKPNNNSVFSFSTTFVFSIVVPPHDLGGHGIAFIMAPNKSLMAAQESQYLGLFNTATNGLQSNHLFAVEFDTNFNPEFGDIDDNHVGVDLNSLVSLHPQTAGYWIDKDHLQNFSLKSGKNIQAWIDYDHVQDQLNVSVSVAGREKPIRPLVSVSNFNLSQVLEDEIYAGFTAATGFYAVAEHYILGWSFSTDGKAPPLDLSGLPSLIRKKSITESKGFTAAVTVAAVVLLVVGLFFLLLRLKEIKDRELIDEWELEYWPHRIPYKDLKAATQGFGNEQLLGRGGFGRVYRGVLATNGLEVAVKCITKDSSEGMKEFIAEISSVGRLQHRNLVQLRGWCRKHKQLFIVYDYMPNGSLDKMIFPSREAKKVVLSWAQRYEILKGVAAGLLYLHEQWDRRVVHRDVKSSNILLDSELNAKLGDFGLARLYDHTENPETTRVVGTVGYIAPEVTNTGKVTPSSDVFSFGIVLLEVACGRRPVDLSMEFALLDWVRDLYEKGKLVHAADPNLDGVYNAEEMERVLKLGLFCSHPQPEKRLTIRTALQILDGQAPLPVHQIPWTSFDVSPKDYRQGAVQVTEEGESEGLLSFGFKSQDMATPSPGLSYDRDSDYEVGR